MPTAAILIYLDGAPRDKQEAVCLRYCAKHGLLFQTVVFTAAAAIKLIRSRAVEVIVAAYAPADGPDLAAAVEAAGGQLERARPTRNTIRDVGLMVEKLLGRGLTIAEVSEVTNLNTGDIRDLLGRRLRK